MGTKNTITCDHCQSETEATDLALRGWFHFQVHVVSPIGDPIGTAGHACCVEHFRALIQLATDAVCGKYECEVVRFESKRARVPQ